MSKRKYAVATVMDQTWGYATSPDVETAQLTIRHPEAHLFDHIGTASSFCSEIAVQHALYLKSDAYKERFPEINMTDEWIKRVASYWVEIVDDEEEFRSREDTW